jgi:hypothetical protein
MIDSPKLKKLRLVLLNTDYELYAKLKEFLLSEGGTILEDTSLDWEQIIIASFPEPTDLYRYRTPPKGQENGRESINSGQEDHQRQDRCESASADQVQVGVGKVSCSLREPLDAAGSADDEGHRAVENEKVD